MFSSNRVRADCGMLHNFDYDLCGTGFECAIRLWFIERFDAQEQAAVEVHNRLLESCIEIAKTFKVPVIPSLL